MTDQQTTFNKEKVTQEQIMPLIKQVHALCEGNDIPFIAVFSFGSETKQDENSREQRFHMGGSCYLPEDDSAPTEMHLAYQMIFHGFSEAAPVLLKESLRALSGATRMETTLTDEAAAASAN